jgi:hypothetical protein
MSSQTVALIHFLTGGDTKNAANRVARGVKVAAEGPQSPLYTSSPDVKAAVDGLTAETTTLKGAIEAWQQAGAALRSASSALGTAVGSWDSAYGVVIATAERRCKTPDDGTKLGLLVRETTHNQLVPPLGILLKQDLKKDLLRIHVLRAPGMETVEVDISADPPTATSWKQLDGHGARHVIPHPPKGTMWVRAASLKASAKSDYATPVSILIV